MLSKKIENKLNLVLFLFILVFIFLGSNFAYSVTNINSCQTINSPGEYNLTITTPSSTCVGLRITPTSLMIGAGGTNTTPTSNILFSDTTATVTGDLNITGNVTATSFKTTSDYRLKTNIKELNTDYSVDYLKPVEYDINGQHDMGFIAHEVQDFFPFLVNGEKDGEEIQSINYNGLISLLVKEIKELKHKYKLLETKLNTLVIR